MNKYCSHNMLRHWYNLFCMVIIYRNTSVRIVWIDLNGLETRPLRQATCLQLLKLIVDDHSRSLAKRFVGCKPDGIVVALSYVLYMFRCYMSQCHTYTNVENVRNWYSLHWLSDTCYTYECTDLKSVDYKNIALAVWWLKICKHVR